VLKTQICVTRPQCVKLKSTFGVLLFVSQQKIKMIDSFPVSVPFLKREYYESNTHSVINASHIAHEISVYQRKVTRMVTHYKHNTVEYLTTAPHYILLVL
jgi:hypothetical protein